MNKPKVIHYSQVPVQYPFEGDKRVRMRVLIGEEDAPTYLMRLFEVDPGGIIPRHEHPWEHEIYVIKGKVKVKIGDEEYIVTDGYAIYIPPNVPHEYVNIGDDVAVFICTIPKLKRT
ncbi:MAG: cupin domain-containing protein [Crenarchaeota archaeon]|nr:cupin domain-containing protein [Thermoproteota archaeon]